MYQHHWTFGRRYLIPCLLVLSIVLLTAIVPGCSEPEVPPQVEIPANYTTYTDDTGLFRISYPPDWEPALSVMQQAEESVKQLVRSIDSDLPIDRVTIVFLAGVPVETGYIPNVSVMVESIPGVTQHDQMVEAETRGAKQIIEDYHEFSRRAATIDGRKMTIIDWEGTYPQVGESHVLQALTLVGKTTWIVTCTPPQGEFDKFESDFQSTVQSLRVLQ